MTLAADTRKHRARLLLQRTPGTPIAVLIAKFGLSRVEASDVMRGR